MSAHFSFDDWQLTLSRCFCCFISFVGSIDVVHAIESPYYLYLHFTDLFDIEFIVISKMYQVYCKFLKWPTPGLYLFSNVIFSFLLKLPLTGFEPRSPVFWRTERPP